MLLNLVLWQKILKFLKCHLVDYRLTILIVFEKDIQKLYVDLIFEVVPFLFESTIPIKVLVWILRSRVIIWSGCFIKRLLSLFNILFLLWISLRICYDTVDSLVKLVLLLLGTFFHHLDIFSLLIMLVFSNLPPVFIFLLR